MSKRLTIADVQTAVGIGRAKINRCIDSGLVSFVRDPRNGYRLFDENAVRALQMYHSLGSLPLRLTHRECCLAIDALSIETLETASNEGSSGLLEFVVEKIGVIR